MNDLTISLISIIIISALFSIGFTIVLFKTIERKDFDEDEDFDDQMFI